MLLYKLWGGVRVGMFDLKERSLMLQIKTSLDSNIHQKKVCCNNKQVSCVNQMSAKPFIFCSFINKIYSGVVRLFERIIQTMTS